MCDTCSLPFCPLGEREGMELCGRARSVMCVLHITRSTWWSFACGNSACRILQCLSHHSMHHTVPPSWGVKKTRWGGSKKQGGGSKKQGGGQKNKVGGQKNRLSVKQLGNPLSFPRFVVTYLEVDCNQFLQSSA